MTILMMILPILGLGILASVLVPGISALGTVREAGMLHIRCRLGMMYVLAYCFTVVVGLMVTVSDFRSAAQESRILLDASARGIAAYAETDERIARYLDYGSDETALLAQENDRYTRSREKHRQQGFLYLACLFVWTASFLTQLGFVTDAGWFGWGEREPQPLLFTAGEDTLCFSRTKEDKPLLIVPDTPENREKYAALLV